MKHLPTHVLLDLADDYNILSNESNIQRYKESAKAKLFVIDTELLSRVPEGGFVTVLGDNGNPVGFEPECYVRLAKAQGELDELSEYYTSHEWIRASH